jgi:hypothetical protein
VLDSVPRNFAAMIKDQKTVSKHFWRERHRAILRF